jgi:hypothetical protein
MTPTQDGARQAPPGLTSLFLLRLALLAVLIAATVALASTRLAEAAPPLQVATSACEPDPLALPPGHPRVFRRRASPARRRRSRPPSRRPARSTSRAGEHAGGRGASMGPWGRGRSS